jgi:hypothetical protein
MKPTAASRRQRCAQHSTGFYRPQLVLLEDRLPLGDTILGALLGSSWLLPALASPDAGYGEAERIADRLPVAHRQEKATDLATNREAVHAVRFTAASLRQDRPDVPSQAPEASFDTREWEAAGLEWGTAAAVVQARLSRRALSQAGSLESLRRLTAVPERELVAGAPSQASSQRRETTTPEPGAAAALLLTSTSLIAAPRLDADSVAFDPRRGEVAIRGGGADNIVQEAVTSGGFLAVTIDGQRHSSDPAAGSFDPLLRGATADRVTGIRFDGNGGQDTLILSTQQLAGDLIVSAPGAKVMTEDVAVGGQLAVQASDITVQGSLRGSAIALAASDWLFVQATGDIGASRGDVGGPIDLVADKFANTGQIHADGRTGGQVAVAARNILNAGRITADGETGNGGFVGIDFTDSYVGTVAGITSADGGQGGSVRIDGGSSGRLYSSGTHEATGTRGGQVDLLGREVVLVGATVDASGSDGGGLVRIGGDFHGNNPAVVNAQTVTVTGATTIRANSLTSGSGGHIAVWSDGETEFAGSIAARGGPQGGDGGFVEVSGKSNLNYGGSADASAHLGRTGTSLLDPKNIIISEAPAGVFPQFGIIDPHPSARETFGATLTVVAGGNVVITNPTDDFGGNGAGAAYLFNGLTGALISSLVGTSTSGPVGPNVTSLSNGNYVIRSPDWNGSTGAATWGSGTTGVTGMISSANSLVGSAMNEHVGFFVAPLANGNYVVASPSWNGGRGAATWSSGTRGITGSISGDNSLVGTDRDDQVGFGSVMALSNGNYVVRSWLWNGIRGAATWGNGSTGVTGLISASNSLVGENPRDGVSSGGIAALYNGNYVVSSPGWSGDRGAETWGTGMAGVRGVISAANSLIGVNPNDGVSSGGVTALANGNYVVASPSWDTSRGAATWGNGVAGTSGTISAINSLVGSDANNRVAAGIASLSNGNYVVRSPEWNGLRGAATWGSGTAGITGTVTSDNSLVGTYTNDWVASSVTPLTNGNYVVGSPLWNGRHGAATWGDGMAGVAGPVSANNSLVGVSGGDLVGDTTALANGNYVVGSPSWNGVRGAATWGSGTVGITGIVSAENSLVGTNPNDDVGLTVTSLTNGNYVVASPQWNNLRGAATWGSGTMGQRGIVSATNSLVGIDVGDQVSFGGVIALGDGNYLVASPNWSRDRGAVTWGDGTSGQTLDDSAAVTQQNSLVSRISGNPYLGPIVEDPALQTFLSSFLFEGRVAVGIVNPSQLGFARNPSGTVAVTPGLLTRTLNTGTAVVLQASNDITIDDPIIVDAGGKGGALTLQAGRSIILNANIRTDNGALTLIANDTLASGVIDAQRDAGNAVITMAGGTTLDTGTGALNIEIRNGAGRTYTSSRSINLQTINAGSVAMVNNGPGAGSNIRLGPVTTTGSQTYSSPNGVTTVAGNLTAADSSITFTNSVVVNDGVSVDAGTSTVNFSGSGLQTLQSGDGATFGNLLHDGTGTLRLTSGIDVTGFFMMTAGTLALPTASVGALNVTGNVTFTDAATLSVLLDGSDSSQIVAGGPIDLGGSTLNLAFGAEPPVGSTFTLLATSDPGPILNIFAGLDEGAIFDQGGFQFQITYQGGPGSNSVVLTRLP